MNNTRTEDVNIIGFNYAVLPPDVALAAQEAATQIKLHLNGSSIEAGRVLCAMKDSLGYGPWGPWLRAEFGMTARTAQRYMASARLADKYDKLSELPPPVLNMLSAPSTSPEVRAEIIQRLEAGEDLTASEIRALIRNSPRSSGATARPRAAKDAPPTPNPAKADELTINCTAETESALRGRLPPTDKRYFWARISNHGNIFVIDQLKPDDESEGAALTYLIAKPVM